VNASGVQAFLERFGDEALAACARQIRLFLPESLRAKTHRRSNTTSREVAVVRVAPDDFGRLPDVTISQQFDATKFVFWRKDRTRFPSQLSDTGRRSSLLRRVFCCIFLLFRE
jgi:hypothetical protein